MNTTIQRPTRAAIGETIRKRRLELELTQQAAASAAGIADSTWRYIEAGTKEPTLASLTTIAGALGWTPSTLLRLAEAVK